MRKVVIILFLGFCSAAVFAQEAVVVADSDTSWTHDPGFAYMPTLDSMLRVTNNRVDSLNATVRIGTAPGNGSSGFTAFFQNKFVQIFFWLMLAVFVAYIIYSIFFRYPAIRALREENGEEIIEGGKLLEADIYIQKIVAAEKEGNFRLAIRYLFMQVLARLDAIEKIQFAPEKTNSDYIREMRNDDFFDRFSKLSNLFIYTWYGHQEISEDDYREVKQLFTEYNKLS